MPQYQSQCCDSAQQRGDDKYDNHALRPGECAHRAKQLHVPGAHPAGNIEYEKNGESERGPGQRLHGSGHTPVENV